MPVAGKIKGVGVSYLPSSLPSRPSPSFVAVFGLPVPRPRSCSEVSIAGGAAPAPTVDALDILVVFQLGPRDATDACGLEVRLFGLYAAETAQL